MYAKAKPKITIEATVYRADGTVEHLGVLKCTRRGLFSRIAERIWKGVKQWRQMT